MVLQPQTKLHHILKTFAKTAQQSLYLTAAERLAKSILGNDTETNYFRVIHPLLILCYSLYRSFFPNFESERKYGWKYKVSSNSVPCDTSSLALLSLQWVQIDQRIRIHQIAQEILELDWSGKFDSQSYCPSAKFRSFELSRDRWSQSDCFHKQLFYDLQILRFASNFWGNSLLYPVASRDHIWHSILHDFDPPSFYHVRHSNGYP